MAAVMNASPAIACRDIGVRFFTGQAEPLCEGHFVQHIHGRDFAVDQRSVTVEYHGADVFDVLGVLGHGVEREVFRGKRTLGA